MEWLRLGAFELHPGERQLLSAGRPVELGARAFDLLLVLVENAGRLVTKATLLERVWPRLVVDENNLPAQIASLRRVLGAGAISTVPRFGYRLDLEVTAADAVEGARHPMQQAPLAKAAPQRAWTNRLSPLVGREVELCAVQDALAHTCLVSVVGGAGVGKTRLAQELLARVSEGAAAWVSLEPIDDARHVPSAIALALGIVLPDGVDRYAALRQSLQSSSVLLILDGAEHLAESLAAPLAALVAQTAGLRALVTSQAPLGVRGETVYRLGALPVPEAGLPQTEIAQYAAVALFSRRAAEADRRFQLCTANAGQVAEICRRLDGNPLALELAAARVPAFGMAALLERIDDRFRLLKQGGHGAEARHGVLQAAFDWSYGLLDGTEKAVFDRLGAFAGSFTLKAAARSAADLRIDMSEAIDVIGRLVDRSLVTVLPTEPPRYRLLETARCYAVTRLTAAGECDAARRRMAAAMLDLLDQSYEEYWSQDEAVWLSQYEPELDNVRAALEWARRHDRDLAVALYGSSWPLYVETDLQAEGQTAHDEAVGLLADTMADSRVGRFWEAIATYESTRRWDRARYAAELAAGRHGTRGDVRARYYALLQLALNWRDDPESARQAFESARVLEDPAWPARLLAHGAMTEGALATSRGQHADARDAYKRALGIALTISERQALAATVNIVELDIACGSTTAALQLGRPLAISLRQRGRRATRFELLVLAVSALLLDGATAEARELAAELHELALRLDRSQLYSALDAMSLLACRDGRFEDAARIAACSDAAHETHGQGRRNPAEERVRASVEALLDERLGNGWRAGAGNPRRTLSVEAACALALGLS